VQLLDVKPMKNRLAASDLLLMHGVGDLTVTPQDLKA
jgi:hypothetical protein